MGSEGVLVERRSGGRLRGLAELLGMRRIATACCGEEWIAGRDWYVRE